MPHLAFPRVVLVVTTTLALLAPAAVVGTNSATAAVAIPARDAAGAPSVDLVADLTPGRTGSNLTSIVDLDGTALFVADGPTPGALWRSDGTASGTQALGVVPSGPVTVAGDLAYFLVASGTRRSALWRTDGTKAGTEAVGAPMEGSISRVVAAGDRLFFLVWHADSSTIELWVSDRTADGARQVASFPATHQGPLRMAAVGDDVWFLASDGVHGNEPWRSDGTAGGTGMVADLTPGSDSHGTPMNSNPRSFTALGDQVFFAAGFDQALWTSDGTAEGTRNLTPSSPGSSILADDLVVLDGRLLFTAHGDGYYHPLWATDGTAEGTVRLSESSAYRSEPTAMGGYVYYQAWDDRGIELWRTDGTPEGTRLVVDLTPSPPGVGARNSDPLELTVVRDRLYFVADDRIHGRDLWSTDGTAEGTALVEDVDLTEDVSDQGNPRFHEDVRDLTAVGDELFLVVADSVHGRELWSTAAPSASRPKTVNTERPTLSYLQVGTRATVKPGTWSPSSLSYTYEWLLDDRRIPGATRSTFTPSDEHLGKSLRVRVIASRAGHRTRSALSAPSVVDGGWISNTKSPRIVGTARTGSTLTALVGSFAPTPLSYHYRWLIDTNPVPGAYGRTFKVPSWTVGRRVTVAVTASRPALEPGIGYSRPTGLVQPAPLKLTRKPVVTGKLRVLSTLRLYVGSTTPSADSYSVLWFRDGKERGLHTTYKLGPLDEGARISYQVTYRRENWAPVVRRFYVPGRVAREPAR